MTAKVPAATAVCAVLIHDLTLDTRPSGCHTLNSGDNRLGRYLTAEANAINMWYDRDIDPK